MGLVLFYARLGWVGGAGRLDVDYRASSTPVTGFLLIDSADGGRLGRVLATRCQPHHAAGLDPGLWLARLYQPHDAQLHARAAGQEYIIAARVKGLSSWRGRSGAMPSATSPVQLVTVVALAYACLLEGAVLTETVFAWPGFGRYLTNALLDGRHERGARRARCVVGVDLHRR